MRRLLSHNLTFSHTHAPLRGAARRALEALAVCSLLSACGGEPQRDDGAESGGSGGTSGSGGSATGGTDATGGTSATGGTDATGGTSQGGSGGGADGPFILLKDINTTTPASDSSSAPRNFTLVGDQVFFEVEEGISHYRLWVTDGTPDGTRRVHDGVSPRYLYTDAFDNPRFAELDGKIVFNGDGELWISDGTSAGTTLLKDIRPGSEDGKPHSAQPFGNRLFFFADDGVSGNEPWVTDGTPSGTYRLADTHPGPGHHWGNAKGLAWNDKYFFYACDENENGHPRPSFWVTDGTTEGTSRLAGGTDVGDCIAPDFDLVAFRDRVFFTFYTTESGVELWVTDGTSAGTELFKDISEIAGSRPQDFHVLDDMFLFFAYGPDSFSLMLWSSDGTPEGTVVVAEVEHAPNDERMQPVGGKLVFNGRPSDTAEPFRLWATDGTPAGTVPIAEVGAFTDLHFTPVGDELLFFGGLRASTDIEPWITDGTEAGTRLVKDIAPGDAGSAIGNVSNPATMVSLGDKAYFAAQLSFDDNQFFVSDGTEEGTELLEPEDATNEFGPMGYLFAFGDQLLVTGRWNDLGFELYRYRPDASR